jgi:hypothetical protein
MGIRRIRDTEGMPIEDFKPGENVYRTVRELYEYGRKYPDGRPHDWKTPAVTPKAAPITKDESQPQVAEARVAGHDDTREAWCRGMGNQSPHPKFDAGPSGSRYSTKVRR